MINQLRSVHIASEGEDEERDNTNSEEAHCAVLWWPIPISRHTNWECYKFKTKQGFEIYKVLGISEDIKQFDDLRHRIKSSSTVSSTDRKSHSYASAVRVRTSTLESIGTIEKHYYQEHGTLPETTDIPENRDLTNKCKQKNKLLRAWNVSN